MWKRGVGEARTGEKGSRGVPPKKGAGLGSVRKEDEPVVRRWPGEGEAAVRWG